MGMNAASFREELRQRLCRHADRVLLRIVLSPAAPPVALTGRELLERSEALAALHVPSSPGGAVLLLLPHSVELFLLHLGLVLRGALPAILAWPTSRVDPEKYQNNLIHQLRTLPADQLLTLPSLAGNLADRLPYRVTACSVSGAAAFEKLFAAHLVGGGGAESPARALPRAPEGALFLQFSGGTTGAQKAVVVTASMLAAQLEPLGRLLAIADGDGVVSWLPMYHDMGLIACLWLPLWRGIPSLHVSASDWILRPELLFKYLEEFQGTLCWMPNFAFAYLVQQRSRLSRGYALGRVRAFINCSEPVRARSMKGFVEAFSAWGVTEAAMQTSYAMAENVFAVTQSRLGSPPASAPRRIPAGATPYADLAYAILDESLVSSGQPLPGMEVRIAHGALGACPGSEPGEIQIRTPCLFAGYWGHDGFTLGAPPPDGWYATGDHGFVVDGDLFVIGRSKDIIIVGGQNIFPEDVEAIVNAVAGVYPGRVVAFGIQDEEHGTESLAVVAELKGEFDPAVATRLGREIHKTVLTMVGIAPRHVAAVPERWIVKSTAGKISRRETRARFLREKFKGTTKADPPPR